MQPVHADLSLRASADGVDTGAWGPGGRLAHNRDAAEEDQRSSRVAARRVGAAVRLPFIQVPCSVDLGASGIGARLPCGGERAPIGISPEEIPT
jgi:hypothetical protein